MSPPMEEYFELACQDGTIPGAVLLASNGNGTGSTSQAPAPSAEGNSGSFHYARAFGARSLETHEQLGMDHIMPIASCTKLMTSIAAMQCVERGLVALDTDVAEILPELAAQGILTKFNEDTREPMISKRQNVITLR